MVVKTMMQQLFQTEVHGSEYETDAKDVVYVRIDQNT